MRRGFIAALKGLDNENPAVTNSTEKVVRASWKYSEKAKGYNRLKLFWKVLQINQLAK